MANRRMPIFFLLFYAVFDIQSVQAALAVKSIPLPIVLEGEKGGRLDGSAWKSSELTGKVFMLVYSTPAASEQNTQATQAVKQLIDEGKISREKFASVAVVNMQSSFWPDFLIEKTLARKQKEYPATLYIRDLKKELVNVWGLVDNSNNIVVFDRQGQVILNFNGELNSDQIHQLIKSLHSAVSS